MVCGMHSILGLEGGNATTTTRGIKGFQARRAYADRPIGGIYGEFGALLKCIADVANIKRIETMSICPPRSASARLSEMIRQHHDNVAASHNSGYRILNR